MRINFKDISEDIELISSCFPILERRDVKELLYGLIIISCREYKYDEKFKNEVEEFANYLELKDKYKDEMKII